MKSDAELLKEHCEESQQGLALMIGLAIVKTLGFVIALLVLLKYHLGKWSGISLADFGFFSVMFVYFLLQQLPDYFKGRKLRRLFAYLRTPEGRAELERISGDGGSK